ncbi:MAG: hypothetical protein AAFX87_28700 [Bacteroidota bacterium]
MKLRIKDSTLRFRLSQTEVRQLREGNEVKATVFLGNTLEQSLHYSIQVDTTADQIFTMFENSTIAVIVPNNLIADWADSEQVGISRVLALDEQKSLSVLIEKDFQCLIDRPGEDETDLYDNPARQQSVDGQ